VLGFFPDSDPRIRQWPDTSVKSLTRPSKAGHVRQKPVHELHGLTRIKRIKKKDFQMPAEKEYGQYIR